MATRNITVNLNDHEFDYDKNFRAAIYRKLQNRYRNARIAVEMTGNATEVRIDAKEDGAQVQKMTGWITETWSDNWDSRY